MAEAKREMIQRLLPYQKFTIEEIVDIFNVSADFVLDIERDIESR